MKEIQKGIKRLGYILGKHNYYTDSNFILELKKALEEKTGNNNLGTICSEILQKYNVS